MASTGPGDSEAVLAELALTRGLTIQMTALSTLGLTVAATALGGALPSRHWAPGVAERQAAEFSNRPHSASATIHGFASGS